MSSRPENVGLRRMPEGVGSQQVSAARSASGLPEHASAGPFRLRRGGPR